MSEGDVRSIGPVVATPEIRCNGDRSQQVTDAQQKLLEKRTTKELQLQKRYNYKRVINVSRKL